MYCLSRDGLRATETTGFGIVKTDRVVRYYRDGEFKFNKQGETVYCLYANNGYLMDVFMTEEEARAKLKEAMAVAASGADMFEF